MKTKYLIIALGLIALSVSMLSCKKENPPDDKNKIDIKGTLMNGDMKSPNIVVTYFEKALCVKFYDRLGDCTISISNRADSVVYCDTVNTFYSASYWYYFYDQPLDRYHLVISDGNDEAGGWFNTFRIVAVKPH
ncbi:MAG: hypothetical protein II671_02435 [Salinivirgaceae bacterium]|nr:hypothetical protein [Salinivirgaceae bacterium]